MPLTYTEYLDPSAFLAAARETLEREEAANNLMLGIGLRLVDQPEYYGSRPYLATVAAEGALRAVAVMTPPYRLQIWTREEPDLAAVDLVKEEADQRQRDMEAAAWLAQQRRSK